MATGTLQHTLTGHTNWVNSTAFSPDGSTLASGGGWQDNTVRLWDVATGTLQHTLTGHTDNVHSVAFSPDGSTLASGSSDKTIRLWDVAAGTLHHTLTEHTGRVFSVVFSPDGRTLASGSTDETIRLWDVATGTVQHTLTEHTDNVYSVAFSLDGGMLASGSADGTVLLWNITPAAPETVREDINGDINSDGFVNIQDLTLVAAQFGQMGEDIPADINGDGIVNIQDLVLVAGAFGEGAAAPSARAVSLARLTASDVEGWLIEARESIRSGFGDPALQNGRDYSYLRGIAVLEQLLASLRPEATALLANYPNPFNPETWIPYELSAAAEVTVTIHASDGKLVRTLALGQLPAGVYQGKNRAAYWDGRNALGEPVASGVYFYTLSAGDFSATRKMVIRK